MREITFRGKDKANQKWIYGNLEIPLLNQSKSKHYIVGYSYGQYQKHEVDSKTVGQYTGLNDNNGMKIFEGDILLINDIDKIIVKYGIQKVNDSEYGDWEYIGYNIPVSYSNFPPDRCEFEVVGNIHENKED